MFFSHVSNIAQGIAINIGWIAMIDDEFGTNIDCPQRINPTDFSSSAAIRLSFLKTFLTGLLANGVQIF